METSNTIFSLYNFILMIPVIFTGLILMPLLGIGFSNAVMPWSDIKEEAMPLNSWTNDERRKVIARRQEQRMAEAREAWRRGDPKAQDMIGRRSYDFEILGIDRNERTK